jgi:hypothetical protein
LALLRLRNTNTVRVLLVSTYELGRQPFGLASPDGDQIRVAYGGSTQLKLILAEEKKPSAN